jgi:hypothetical protein
MTLSPLDIYRRHSENARALVKGLTQAERAHKAAIGSGNALALDFAARVHHMTVGLMAETLLRKIVSDPAGFNDRERRLLGQQRNQLDRWKTAVDLAFRRHYAVPVHLDIDASSAGPVVAAQHATLIALLENDLAEIIEDRNELAHGQWSWVLNSKETRFVGAAPAPMNYRAIEVRGKLVREIEALIQDLVVSEPTFARDYPRRFAAIQALRNNLAGPDYPQLVRQIAARRRR